MWLAGAVAAPGEPGGVHAVLLKVDPASERVVATIDLGPGAGADVALDATGVWTLWFSNEPDGPSRMVVSRIDPQDMAVAATIRLDAGYGHHLFAVGGVVVAEANATHDNIVAGTVLNIIDPATAAVRAEVPLGAYARVVADGHGMWALSAEHVLTIDPATGAAIATADVITSGDAAGAGQGAVWFVDPEDRAAIHRFDSVTGTVDVSVDLDRGSTPIDVAVAPGSAWVLDYGGTVTRVGLG